MIKQTTILVSLAAMLTSVTLWAQPQMGGRPAGLSQALALPVHELPTPDVAAWRQADEKLPGERFAAPLVVDLAPSAVGQWEDLPHGGRRWTLRLRAPGALGLAVFYDQFRLPVGARLFCYTPTGSQVLGAYTSTANRQSGRTWTGFVAGEEVVLEYEAPAGALGDPFHIGRIDYAYRADRFVAPPVAFNPPFGFGTSKACHQNINCPAGADWQVEKTGVCRIIVVVEEGSGYCTGTLMNNTSLDGTPYLLTGFHCQDGFTPEYDMWRFDFFYAAADCPNPATAPPFTPVLGATLRAGRQANDFLLLEITDPLVGALPVYFSGWDRSGTPPASAGVIHHPSGDIQKIAISTTNSTVQNTVINWNNNVTTPAQHHFRVRYSNGTIEVGSSGAALFNQDHHVVGQLHGSGNDTTCNNTLGFFGRLSLAWEGGGSPETRLRDWLDPLGMAPTILAGLNAGLSISGLVRTENNLPVGNVEVTIVNFTQNDTTETATGADGVFVVGGLGLNDSLQLSFNKADMAFNGVSTQDIIVLRRHILDLVRMDSPYKALAMDVNNTGSLTTLDIIQVQRVILASQNSFPGVPFWRFTPAGFVFNDPNDPWADNPPIQVFNLKLNNGIAPDLSFVGIRSGDANLNANPN